MRIVVVALAACTVADVSLDGKECPCATGYTCQPATNTCIADRGDASSSCLSTVPGALLYESDFDDLDGWSVGGGTWTAANGTAMQTDPMAKLAFAYPQGVSASDYRIVSSMMAGDGGSSSAVELAARIDGTAQYHCNWDPLGGGFQIMYTIDASTNGVIVSTQLAPAADPAAPVTMEFDVRGDTLACCLREIPGAMLTGSDTRFASGRPGLKTYEMTGAYDDFHVFQ